jgi:hypothetical protein
VGATYFPRAVVLTTVSQPVNVCHSHGLVTATIARAAAAAEANMKLPALSHLQYALSFNCQVHCSLNYGA